MLQILHAADLHLDSPFAGLSPEQAAQRRGLQRQLPGQIVDLANDRGCQLLLLAGDVFDGERVCPETIEALQAAFARCRARVFIAPGNHDPYDSRSPWACASWPANVHLFTGAQECVTLPELVSAPVQQGQRLGTMTVYAGEEVLRETPLVAAEAVERQSWGDLFQLMLRRAAMAKPTPTET